ncbi:MAG TPA: nitrilase-related carbon-nitrogen hydrolase [Syntrophomonas sp.]|nr:nitrilase-related carbon-nitrogen hydrolase [Syntrophomonas sp.]
MQTDRIIAAVQMASEVGNIQHNIDSILELTSQAAKAGAGFIVFPEMALQGYSHTQANDLAVTADDPVIELLCRTASNLQITLLVGFAERSDSAPKPYISQLIAFPDGTAEVYRKVHLGRFEKEWFAAGTQFPVFNSQGVKFAVGICWDWHFPEMAAIYSLKGAEILFAPHASLSISGNRLEIWQHYMGARAYDNSVYLAACNMCGKDRQNRNYSGGAAIWSPKGEVLTQSEGENNNIVYALVSAERINNLRTRKRETMRDSFFLADRKKNLYHELLELEIESGE